MTRTLVFAAVSLLVLTSPGVAPAQITDPVVRTQLDSATVLMARQGLAPQGAAFGGALVDGEEGRWSVELVSGRTYLIVGVCDADCSDLDMVLLDPSGSEIDRDSELDDVPMLAPDVTAGGTFSLLVHMIQCTVAPCGYGVMVFAANP